MENFWMYQFECHKDEVSGFPGFKITFAALLLVFFS